MVKGLTEKEVQERIEAGKVNTGSSAKTKSEGQIIKENVCTLFNLINIVFAVLIFITGSYRNMLFLTIITLNTIISIAQEIHSKHILDRLSALAISKLIAIRDGNEVEVPVDKIVIDDIIKFKTGNQVAVDCEVVEGEVEVNESFITGESDTLLKKKGDKLLSGSYIVAGTAIAKVEKVGSENFMNKISEGTKTIKKVNSEIMKSLNQIIKTMAIVIIPVGLVLFFNQYNIEHNWQTAIVNSVAALIGMIPEGLILLTSSVLALSCIRLSRSKVLVQQLYCIETLARVDTICFDKTGTLTEGRMRVEKVISVGSTHKSTEVNKILASIVEATGDDNATAIAIKEYVGDVSIKKATDVVPFSSKRKCSGATIDGKKYLLGAPEFVLKDSNKEIEKYVDDYRVLVITENDELIAIVLITDVIRKEAKQTIQYFKDQGVEVKIISGDNPVTVSKIAKKCGVDKADKYVDMSKLSNKEIVEAVDKYTIFGRVSPEQKKLLVKLLKDNGHTVAMTGDGVNDVLALRESDCSVAMANGSDAAKNVSELVLLDSNFASMPKIVQEGRQTINNIQRSSSLFIVKTIYSTVLAVLFIILNLKYPFMPIQMSLISTVTIGIPSFLLALEPNRERVKGKFMETVIKNAAPTALMTIVGLTALSIIARNKGWSSEVSATASIIFAGITGLLLIFKLSLKRKDEDRKLPFSIYRLSIAILCTLLLYIGLKYFSWLFMTIPL